MRSADGRRLATGVLLAVLPWVSGAFAATLERVEVTGSRVLRVEDESASPVQKLDRSDIERTGAGTLLELLQRISNAGTSLTDVGGDGTGAPGASSAGLHGYGPQQLVVLLNGRRVAPYPLANGAEIFTNLDSLPFEAIERVEILRSGASALYGSEAMAGVINVITRHRYQGVNLKLTEQHSMTSHSFASRGASLGGGWGDWDRDGFNAWFSAEHYERDAVNWRSVLAYVNPELTAPFPSFGTPSTFSQPANVNFAALPGCATVVNGLCRYDRYERFMAMPGAQRSHVMGRADWQLGSGTQAFAELMLSRTRTSYFRPFLPYGPALGATTWANPQTNEILSFTQRGLPAGHPLNAGPDEADLRYRFTDMRGDNVAQARQDRLLAGLRGNMEGWDWEAALGTMGGTASTRERTQFSLSGFHQVIGNDDPSQTDPLFFQRGYRLGQQNSAAVIDKLFPAFGQRGRARQVFVDLRADGELARWDGRPVQMAWGAELRHERFAVTPSDNLLAGDIVGNGASRSDGRRSQASAFAELDLPVLPALSLQPALRLDRVGSFATHASPRVAARWAVAPQWALRATWEAGFRAPNLSESAESTHYGFDSAIADPRRCPQAGALANALRAQLEALPAADPQRAVLAARADIVYNNECLASIASITRQNPSLRPETSRSLNLGLVWTPSRDASVTLDAWRIERRDEIGLPVTLDLVRNEAAQPPGTLTRLPLAGDRTFSAAEQQKYGVGAGALSAVTGGYRNLTHSRRAGIDLGVNSRFATPWGELTLGGNGVYWLDFRDWDDARQALSENRVGTQGCRTVLSICMPGCGRAASRAASPGTTRGSSPLSHGSDDAAYSIEGCASRGWSASQCRMKARISVDGQLSWLPAPGWDLSLSVRNLFDRRPPVSLRSLQEGGGGIIPQDTSDVQRRMLRVTLAWKH